MSDISNKKEEILIVTVKERFYEEKLKEMISLVENLQALVILTITMHKDLVSHSQYIGKGKLEEVRKACLDNDIKTVVINANISPAQKRELEESLQLKVLDRTEIILAIFASRALTKEAQLQVEVAQMHYLMPRLTGMWQHLSRQQGGIGTRGVGEKQIEIDRRQIKKKMSRLKDELEDVKKSRAVQRKLRGKSTVPSVALVGYTNSGKSSLFNYFNGKSVLAKDQLFATLDTITKKVVTPEFAFYLVDTVGFITDLPHFLIDAFKATLEEVLICDVLLHIIDASNANYPAQIMAVNEVLTELGIAKKPIINVYNKIDLLNSPLEIPDAGIQISVKNGTNIDKLMLSIKARLEETKKNELS